MSRIFDALQRTGVEQTGVEYPDILSITNQIFEAPHIRGDEGDTQTSQESALKDPLSPTPEEDLIGGFPTVETSVARTNRLVFMTEPGSLPAEKFRFLGVRLRQMRQHRALKKVLITSTIPQEGKSLVSANLAGVLARRKEKVLLLEGDLRRPVLAEQFGLGRLAGLTQWLQANLQAPSNIYRLASPNVWLMPAGDPAENPLELIQSGRFGHLMMQLTSLFDWIIIDSPPLLPLADSTVFARLVDGILLVVREGITERAPLQKASEVLQKSDLLGVVLNACSDGNQHNYYQRYVEQRGKQKTDSLNQTLSAIPPDTAA